MKKNSGPQPSVAPVVLRQTTDDKVSTPVIPFFYSLFFCHDAFVSPVDAALEKCQGCFLISGHPQCSCSMLQLGKVRCEKHHVLDCSCQLLGRATLDGHLDRLSGLQGGGSEGWDAKAGSGVLEPEKT